MAATSSATGGSRGIGAAIAKRLASDGANVAITYTRSPRKAEEMVAEIEAADGKAVSLRADSANAQEVHQAVQATGAGLAASTFLSTTPASRPSSLERQHSAAYYHLNRSAVCIVRGPPIVDAITPAVPGPLAARMWTQD